MGIAHSGSCGEVAKMLGTIDYNLAHRSLDGLAQLAATLVGIVIKGCTEIGYKDIAVGIDTDIETHWIAHTALEIY